MTSSNPALGIVLAAGGSSRMGRPKALLERGGRSFVEHAVHALRGGGCAQVVVVSGAVDSARLRELDLLGAAVAHNPRWAEGPTVSLQVGLTAALALQPATSAVLLHTVDRPRVRASTVRALLLAHRSDPAAVWQPEHDGRGGHPLLWPAITFEALAALAPAQTRRALLRGTAGFERRRLAVKDPGILDNVDDPSALDDLV